MLAASSTSTAGPVTSKDLLGAYAITHRPGSAHQPTIAGVASTDSICRPRSDW